MIQLFTKILSGESMMSKEFPKTGFENVVTVQECWHEFAIKEISNHFSYEAHLFLPSWRMFVESLMLDLGLILLAISGLFTLIFKIPYISISPKHVFAGALVASVLFLIGKFVIGFYLGHSQIGTTYGTAASIVILMLWIYYSSIILYFGVRSASFLAVCAVIRYQKNRKRKIEIN